MTQSHLSGNTSVLIVVVGPTAVGKTEFCVRLAKMLDCEVFSADSRQFYKEMNIGTAKPSLQEMDGVPHHFVDSHSVGQYFSAGDYERALTKALDTYFSKHSIAILTGGSGLYIKAVLEGMDDMPDFDPTLRQHLMQRLNHEGIETLGKQLKTLDPITYQSIDLSNSQRVVRALEVCLGTGKPFSEFKRNQSKVLPFETIKIGIERPREVLYNRINKRVDDMITAGLISEAQRLVNFKEHNALKTVGYKEVFDFFDGKTDKTQMVELIKRNTRRYAKRQLTWFKNQDNFEWFDANKTENIFSYINSEYNRIVKG